MNRDEFLSLRKRGIGGSDAPAIMGLSPWKTPLDVYKEKVEGAFDNDSPAKKRGRELERPILEEYSLRTGNEVKTNLPMLRHKDYPFLIGNIDGLVEEENILLEAKSSRLSPYSWAEGIPIYYKAQIAHYCNLSNPKSVHVPVLFNSWKSEPDWRDFRIFPYWRDHAFEKEVLDATINFWQNHVLKKIPPQATCSKDASYSFAKANDEVIEADANIESQIKEYESVYAQKKELEEKEEQLKLGIMKYMGDASILKAPGFEVSWKNVSSSRIDLNRLKLDHPAIYQEYTKEINSRSFKLKRREYE